MSVLTDLQLDQDGDLLIVGGDLALVEGVDAIAQRLTIKLRHFRGEWYRDTSFGVPYYETDQDEGILGKGRSLDAIEAVIKDAILEVDEVLAITFFSSSLDRSIRRLSVTFSATTTDGEIVDLVVPVEV